MVGVVGAADARSVANRNNQEAPRTFFVSHARTNLIDCTRPRGRKSPVPVVGRDRQAEHPLLALRGGNLDSRHGLVRDVAIQVGIMLPIVSKRLHRLQAVPQYNGVGALEDGGKAPVEGQPGHFCAVPVRVRGRPIRVNRKNVFLADGEFEQRVSSIDASIQMTYCRCVVGRRLNPGNRLLNELSLIAWRKRKELPCQRFRQPKLGENVE